MNEFSTFSFWISLVGTLVGIAGFVITCITLKNTADIKTNIYKKRLCRQSLTELEIAVKDMEGRIGYINKDKIIDKVEFVKQFSSVIESLNGLRIIFSKGQEEQFEKIRTTYNSLVDKENESAIEQLNFLSALKQFCIQIITYYKENDYE